MRFLFPVLLAVAALLCGHGGVDGKRGRSGGVHLVYTWQERVDEIQISHEIHLYGNGFMRYAQQAAAGPLQETTLPNDKAFVTGVIALFRTARTAKQLSPPCGAPQGGVLSVRLNRRPLRIDLSVAKQWNRYGRLARQLLARVVGTLPDPLEADCQPLRLRVDPNRLARPRSKPAPSLRKDERRLLQTYGKADSDDARRAALTALARMRNGDRFFRWALLRHHPGSLAARRLIRRHAAELVRSVRNLSEARELLGYLTQGDGPEVKYHRALLQLVLGRTAEAGRNLEAFYTGLNQLKAAAREAKGVVDLAAAQLDARRRRPPWGRVRRSFARQFHFWLALARKVWAGDPEQAPPLAMLLYRRALHYARVGPLNPSVRSSAGGATVVRAARGLVQSHFGRLAKGRWDALPFMQRQDLMSVSGVVRRSPRLFPKAWVASQVEDYPRTVCRMIRMHYFAVVGRFIERVVAQKKSAELPLRLAQGRCLVEMERWTSARKALSRAVALGGDAARIVLVEALVEQGDLDGAERELKALAHASAPALVLESRLWRLRERPTEALRAAEEAVKRKEDAVSRYAVGRSREIAGQGNRARAAYAAAMVEASSAGQRARLALARLELATGRSHQALDVAWPLTTSQTRRFRAAGHAVIAMAAALDGRTSLSALQIARALYHAGADPEALVAVSDLLVAHGKGVDAVLTSLHLARGKRPGWSRVYALEAFVYGQLGQLDRALQSVTTALHIRPTYPQYRAIERALVRLRSKPRK